MGNVSTRYRGSSDDAPERRLPALREMDPEDAAEYRKSAAKACDGADGEVPADPDVAAKQDLE